MESLQEMRIRLESLSDQGKAIFKKAHEEDNRDLTESEAAQVEDLGNAFDSLQRTIACRERVEGQVEHMAAPGRRVHPDAAKPPEAGEGAAPPIPNQGWKSMGEFFRAVKTASVDGMTDPRLRIKGAATTWSNETSGADGGFLVPTEFSQEIMRHMGEANSLLPLTSQTPVAGNSMVFPTSETTPWGTTGVIAYWEAEAATGTETKVATGQMTLRLHKLLALAPVTEELMEDAVALEDHLTREAGASIRYKVNDAIVNGNGVGQPLGFVNSGALVTIAKEVSQTADTINAANLGKMFAAVPASMISDGAWLVNPDAYNQFIQMTIGQQPVWTAPNQGLQSAPAGLALGLPIIMTETCQTLGDLGDIYRFAGMGYKTIVKSAGVTTALSVDYYFASDQPVFKFRFRMDGRPWQKAAITPPNSTIGQSPFVALAARAS